MLVEGVLPAILCLVTLLTSEQCLQFERFRLEYVQMVNKASIFKTKLTSDTDTSRVNRNTFQYLTFHVLDSRHVTNYHSAGSGQMSWHPP